jgi:hypothetical protein
LSAEGISRILAETIFTTITDEMIVDEVVKPINSAACSFFEVI